VICISYIFNPCRKLGNDVIENVMHAGAIMGSVYNVDAYYLNENIRAGFWLSRLVDPNGDLFRAPV
jgi:hypothetical protein